MITENIKVKRNKNEKGQTLLFVIVAVTIAMAVGVAVSTRTISSLKRAARTDTSARVIAAAEGGIENLLGKTFSELDGAINGDCASIGATAEDAAGTCVYVFNDNPQPDETNDLISSQAVVKVETFEDDGEPGGGYSFSLEPGSLREVNLNGYTGTNQIKICWKQNSTSTPTAIQYYSYNANGEVKKGGLKPTTPILQLSDRFITGTTESPYDYCSTVTLIGTPYGLRIKALYNTSMVTVIPLNASGELPVQGYKFTSVGEIKTSSGSEEKATVIVRKSLPHAADIFDYGIYTPTTLTGSN